MRRTLLLLFVTAIASILASGAALAAIINGTDGPETITGTAYGDILDGKGGNDKISGLAGGDNIKGGDGDDLLFGGDEYQSVASDGGSNIKGEDGNDTLVGSSGADTLNGGPGNDTILEGPVNDSAAEIIYGGDGDDFINSAGIPASRETVIDCGAGTDEVQADILDVVSSNCENVDILDPKSNDANQEEDPYIFGINEAAEDASQKYTPQSHIIASDSFECTLPPKYRLAGYRRCHVTNTAIAENDQFYVGITYIEGTGRVVAFKMRGYAFGPYPKVTFGYATLSELRRERFSFTHPNNAKRSKVTIYGRARSFKYTDVTAYWQYR